MDDDTRDVWHGMIVLIAVVLVALVAVMMSGCFCASCPVRVEYRTVEVPVPVPCGAPPDLPEPALPELAADAQPEDVVVVLVQALRDVLAWGREQATALEAYRQR